jgi:hypothetical protein
MSDLVNLIDAAEEQPKKRGSYRSGRRFQTDALPTFSTGRAML